jgi:hypothetical protein
MGGYIAVPPTPGYVVLRDGSPQDLPEVLKERLLGLQEDKYNFDSLFEGFDADECLPATLEYAQAALEEEVGKLALVEKGGRNHALNKAAYKLGGYSEVEGFSGNEVAQSLIGACYENGLVDEDGLESVIKTIKSGWAEGAKQPRAVKETTTEDVDGIPMWTGKKAPRYPDHVRVLEAFGYLFELNVTTDQVYVNGEELTDVSTARIRSQMYDYNYRNRRAITDNFFRFAEENRYHPVHRYLEDEVGEWDGEDHIAKLAGYFNSDDNFQTFLRKWLIGAVAKSYEGAQNRMLILDGPQGVGKSYFVRWLASGLNDDSLYIEGPIDPDDKDFYVRLARSWIWEVSELGSTTRRNDRESLKYFLSTQKVTVRKAYGRQDINKRPLASFIGTVNHVEGLLDDPTGYRRFMPSTVSKVDWSYAKEVDVNQLWAQAKALYDDGESWILNDEEATHAREAAMQYEVDDPIVDILIENTEFTGNEEDYIPSADLWEKVKNTTPWSLGNKPRAEKMAIAEAMRKIYSEREGFVKKNKRVDGKVMKVYFCVKWTGFQINL